MVEPGGKAVTILGPTASGKTEVALKLAGLLDAEIISADSMQVYEGMDIGTAKPSPEEMKLVKHHMVDVCSPCEPMSVAKYCELAMEAHKQVTASGHLTIIVGGTGLYLDALTRGFLFPDDSADENLRAQLYARAEDEGSAALHKQLQAIDPVAASRIHENDTRRVVRALEVYSRSGRPISEQRELVKEGPRIPSCYYGICIDRALLAGRISDRVDRMMAEGLLGEVEKLLAGGFKGCKVAMQAIGYKELISYLDGGSSLEDAVSEIKKETRKYSKRQMTWFRRCKDIKWYDSGLMSSSDIAEAIACDYRSRKGNDPLHDGEHPGDK